MDFATATSLFKSDQIKELSSSKEGMRFLKLRSLSRKQYMEFLIEKHSINVDGSISNQWLEILYNSNIHTKDIDSAILELYEADRSLRRSQENNLINELYKVQALDWGGLHQNNLERTIVDRYVKNLTSYPELDKAIENQIHKSMRSYVITSWYNHWTSMIIEDIFNDHPKVVPAIGRVKKIDFFVNGKPFDLKVTYLPESFIKEYRRSHGLPTEKSMLRKKCKGLRIGFDASVTTDSIVIPDLWKKLQDHPDDSASDLLHELQSTRDDILTDVMNQPDILARWLYENQGARRFDASNRMFLILVNKPWFFDSWELKRAQSLLSEHVNAYLDELGQDAGFKIDFIWEGERHTVETDMIFVVKS